MATSPLDIVYSPGPLTSIATFDGMPIDLSGYAQICVQVTVPGVATINYEESNDYNAVLGTGNWFQKTGYVSSGTGNGVTTSTTQVSLVFKKNLRWFRARVSAYTSGNIAISLNASAQSGQGTGTAAQGGAGLAAGAWFVKVVDSGGVNVETVKAASTAAVATDTALVVSLSPNNGAVQGAAGTAAASWFVKLVDAGGVNTGTIKAASTAPATTDPALVVTVSPNLAGFAATATTAVASALVAKATAGGLLSASVTTGATPGFIMLFNATSAPADGAVTPYVAAIQIAANATVGISYVYPLAFATGMTIVFSSTGPFTKTASATASISAQVS